MTLKRVTVAGFTKIESTVRYLGIKVEALAIAEQVDARNTRGRAETFCSASNRQFVAGAEVTDYRTSMLIAAKKS